MGRNSKRQAWLLVLAVVFIALAGLVWWALSGNQGQIEDSTGHSKVRSVPAYQDYDGRYIAFRYRGIYQAQQLKAADQDLELVKLTADTNYDKRVAVAVSKLDGGLDSNSAYIFRRSHTESYTSRTLAVAGQTATLWAKKDGSEQTVFIPHGGVVAVLAFSTAGNADDLQPEVSALLKTFRWKQ